MTRPTVFSASATRIVIADRRNVRRLLIVAALCLCATSYLGQNARKEPVLRPVPPTADTRHFILLLDDSGDSPLRPRPYRTPARDVAAALFRPIDGGPGFQPGRDILTIAFFQIPYEHEGRCFVNRPLSSLTPEGMFDMVVPDKPSLVSEVVFAGFIEAQIHGDCRFAKHCFSPIQLALPLVVVAANRDRMQKGNESIVSKLYILRASNDKVNPLGDEDVSKLNDRKTGEALVRTVSEQMAFVPIDRIGGTDPELQIVRFRADAKLYPASRPDAAVELSVSVVMRRTAISQGTIRLDAPGQGIIRIVPALRLTPIEVVLTTEAAGNRQSPWVVGGRDLPREVRVPLTACRQPCRRGADGAFFVDAVSAVFPQRDIPASSATLSPGLIRASTRFSYGERGVYNGLLVDGPRTLFEVIPEPEPVIPASFLYPTRTVIDNQTLASQYRGSDRDGISSSIALERIVARRRYMLTAALIGILALLAASVYRRFTPAPYLEPNVVRVSLTSAQIPKHVDAASVEVRNTSRAWFRPLQWKRRGTWTLTVERVTASWPSGRQVDGATGPLLSLQRFDRSSPSAAHIAGNGEDRVALVLNPRELARTLPPAHWDGEGAVVTIGATLSLQPGQSRNIELKVRLDPEEARQPRISLEEIRDEVQWDAEEDLDFGQVRLVSQAEHHFAKPATFAYSFSLLREGVSIYDSRPSTVTVVKSQQVAARILVPRGATSNPATVSEDWTLRIVPERSPSVELTITVRRDMKAIVPKVKIDAASAIEPALLIWNDDGPIISMGSSVVVASGVRLRLPASSDSIRVGGGGTLRVCTLEISHALPELGGQFDVTVLAALAIGNTTLDVPLIRPSGKSKEGSIRADETRILHGDVSDERLHSIIQDHELRQEEAILTIQLEAVICARTGTEKRKALVEVPLRFEREERGSILSIDLGNSAIAIGTLVSDGGFGSADFRLTNCQTVVIRGSDLTLGSEDPDNQENASGLLPSAFCIEVDKRRDAKDALNGKPGTHWSVPPRPFSGSDPRILSLPALTTHYSAFPQRIVRSIKQLVGSDYTKMELLDLIATEGEPVDVLEVDALLTAVLSAVAGTYANALNFERVVHTVPNTFAGWQLDRVTSAIRAAFPKAIPEWIRPLRESDAVMYHYLDRNLDHASSSVVLFYDFGSGTIDLTLARITSRESGYEATILARIGLDRAGAHLDRLLAQCIHRHLEAATKDVQDAYRYRLFGSGGRLDSERAGALAAFRRNLSEAKHAWKIRSALEIDQKVNTYAIIRPEGWEAVAKAGMGVSNDPSKLLIAWDMIQEDPEIKEYLRFVRTDLIDECLRLGSIPAEALNKIVLSGRGALWPGFESGVSNAFSNATVSLMTEGNDPASMKTAVVRGAAAWMRSQGKLVVQESAPRFTYVAFSELDRKRGSWSKLVVLGDAFVKIGAGKLALARIDFEIDEGELPERLRHPLWNRLIRFYPSTRSCEKGTEARVERFPGARDVIVLKYMRAENRISPDDKSWSVGEWSFSEEFGN